MNKRQLQVTRVSLYLNTCPARRPATACVPRADQGRTHFRANESGCRSAWRYLSAGLYALIHISEHDLGLLSRNFHFSFPPLLIQYRGEPANSAARRAGSNPSAFRARAVAVSVLGACADRRRVLAVRNARPESLRLPSPGFGATCPRGWKRRRLPHGSGSLIARTSLCDFTTCCWTARMKCWISFNWRVGRRAATCLTSWD